MVQRGYTSINLKVEDSSSSGAQYASQKCICAKVRGKVQNFWDLTRVKQTDISND